MAFTHLHVASCLSSHHGTAWPEQLIAAQAADGATAAALTDRDGLYGAVRHIRTCLDCGIDPIVGVDLLCEGFPVTVLAHGHDHGLGWASLCRLISAAWRPRPGAPKISGSANRDAGVTRVELRAMLCGEAGPVATVLLGPASDVGLAVLQNDRAWATAKLRDWNRLLPGGVAVEVVCHYTRPDKAFSLPQAAAMLALARAAGTPAVLTNAVRYLEPGQAVAGDVLDSAAQLLPVDRIAHTNAQAWLKPSRSMQAIAADVAGAAGLPTKAAIRLLDDTSALAGRCVLDPVTDVGWRQPKVPSLTALHLEGDPQAILTQMCRAGLVHRYPSPPPGERRTLLGRLDDELGVIARFGFATYFLTIADIVTMIRAMDVRVQARGSGAGSLVNYVLGISSVDPLEHDLLFERFLGVQRSTLPDIDLDVESARRHDICRAIVDRYGSPSVTLMATQNQYRARGAVRDAGLALGMDDADIDHIAKALWRLDAGSLMDALDTRPEMADVALAAKTDPRIGQLFNLAGLIDRLPRHVSMHPCGVIVSDMSLWDRTPTQPSGLGLAMSQYDKDDIDDMGLLKLDVLGVRMQSAIAHALGEIRRTTGEVVDIDAIPPDDPATFQMICTTNTLGVFQIESPGQRELVGKMQPRSMTDIIADISLFRPGPMKSDMITPYLESRHGFASTMLHPRFRSFLADAHGVVIYHEHVLRIIHDCTGVSLAEADEIRRHLGDDAEAIEARFRAAAGKRLDDQGRRIFTPRQIDDIWATLASFGSFGFCKAHACAFAVTTYQSAWLKTHHQAAFLAGLLEHDPGMYPRRLLIAEARRLGVPILGVDVNSSTDHYHLDDGGVRVPFTQISGIAKAEVKRLIAGQPYDTIADVIQRARPSRPTVIKLATVGAFDSLANGRSRGDIIAHARRLTAAHRHPAEGRTSPPGQDPLVILPEAGSHVETIPPSGAELSTADVVTAELGILHADITAHVLDPWRPFLQELGVTPADQLLAQRNQAEVLVAGVRVASGTPPTKTGQRVAFVSLDDGTGVADVAFFDDAQHATGPGLFRAHLMLVKGVTRRTGPRGISITATQAWDLDDIAMTNCAERVGRLGRPKANMAGLAGAAVSFTAADGVSVGRPSCPNRQ